MIKIEHLKTFNWEGAFRGMRNPLESWDKSDSDFTISHICLNKKNTYIENPILGINDLKLAKQLVNAAGSHRKFMRQIFISCDITAPMSWWWDTDTYKICTVKNSTSRMHMFGKRDLEYKDFSFDDEFGDIQLTKHRIYMVNHLNEMIHEWRNEKDPDTKKEIWREMILDGLQSYNFKSTFTMNYENMINIYHDRKNHKQNEFRIFCKYMKEHLPYSELFTGEEK